MRVYTHVYTREAHFRKSGMYGGSVREWVHAWDVFRRTPSQGGRGRRAFVDSFRDVFFQCLVGFRVFCVRFLFVERTRPAARMTSPCLTHLSPSIDGAVVNITSHERGRGFTRLILDRALSKVWLPAIHTYAI